MSGNDPDLQAPQSALKDIANGINLAHAELKELGMIGEATTGRGFADLALSGLELGHGLLTAKFETFCERWEWGVRELTLRGNGFALAVGLSAGGFNEHDQYVKDTIKISVNSLNGNPHLTEDQVKDKSWDDIKSQSPYDNAKWDWDDMVQAHEESKQTWNNTAYDVGDAFLDTVDGPAGINPTMREHVDADFRERFDPDEATVAQAEEPRWGESR
ncbi:hypothetical protein OHS70_20480 [Streptomyces sp. NBC_00390]|uniref:hypothetical protein n=1 Tax=Streptomyces sp. NBC_00390 TaxID=2975736 RepID=UPI002E1A845B